MCRNRFMFFQRFGKKPGFCQKPGFWVVQVWTLILLLALALAAGVAGGPPVLAQEANAVDATDPIPVMAYYYIWFQPDSWDRAKKDYPTLGRYSSDDRAIMEQHIRWAKAAGIDGFIVSWKSTFQLDSRLEQLMDVAAAQDFQLWIIYQGLDFDRNPLPVGRVDSDLAYFIERYVDHPAFDMLDKPVVIWSGTWKFSSQDIAMIGNQVRDQIYLLATERNLDGYLRLRNAVDGNAYYWASVNPDTFPGYQAKLDAMGAAVHEDGGLWIAPAAPGFDATMIGGRTIVDRRDGEILRREMDAAIRSSPDAVGLISWNEFSENTHIEPSQQYGSRYLEVLADIQQGEAPRMLDFDSSAPATTNRGNFGPFYILAGMAAFVTFSIGAIARRNLHRRRPVLGNSQ